MAIRGRDYSGISKIRKYFLNGSLDFEKTDLVPPPPKVPGDGKRNQPPTPASLGDIQEKS